MDFLVHSICLIWFGYVSVCLSPCVFRSILTKCQISIFRIWDFLGAFFIQVFAKFMENHWKFDFSLVFWVFPDFEVLGFGVSELRFRV